MNRTRRSSVSRSRVLITHREQKGIRLTRNICNIKRSPGGPNSNFAFEIGPCVKNCTP